MKKIISIIGINLIFFILILGICEIAIYKYQAKIFYKNHSKIYKIENFGYNFYLPQYMTNLKNHFNGQNKFLSGRRPDGLEYKDKTPITIFGCSFAFGEHLDFNQTISYKLAHRLKRPIYNRAISGTSFQQMYMQTTSNEFYKDVPPSDTVIYIMIDDHYRRTLLNYFDVLNHGVNIQYHIKDNKLILNNYENKFTNFIKSLYSVKLINHSLAHKYINNPKNAEKLTDMTLLYFIESRKNLEKNWNKKIKFIVILYETWDIQYNKLLRKKLEENGFIAFSTKNLTDEDLTNKKYLFQDNFHPTETAWDLLTPKIIERANL